MKIVELSTIISFIGILISISISSITLWLTHFRGPDITLLKIPEFKVNDENLHQNIETHLRQGYIFKWVELEPSTFVFANHGGKSGTITNLDLHFVPHESFASFYESFHRDFSLGKPIDMVRPPLVTIKEGDNQYIEVKSTIYMIDWKDKALAEVLDPNLKLDDIITKALEKSKEKFEEFRNFLEKSQELGRVSCTITLTKGRLSTGIKTEKLLENEPVTINCDKAISSLRNCVHRWESLGSTKVHLLNKMKGDLQNVLRQLKASQKACADRVNEKNIGGSKLQVEAWKRLNDVRDSDDRKIRWFLLRSREGFEQKLTKLYERIAKYNDLIQQAILLGNLRREKDFRLINTEREGLQSEIKNIVEELSELHSK